ncbi:hypothetical protein O6H91_11G033700 [Diphasiastrum complanatum]|uniref:Uncharacterized protein n=1 Tax=Diphasiastrum complanatum TaxID=34168 RepID=A0ACC2C915_DIPCM|nr:hypothetical protein O6H91_11G033700 [Diphasiastrum complanatum]
MHSRSSRALHRLERKLLEASATGRLRRVLRVLQKYGNIHASRKAKRAARSLGSSDDTREQVDGFSKRIGVCKDCHVSRTRHASSTCDCFTLQSDDGSRLKVDRHNLKSTSSSSRRKPKKDDIRQAVSMININCMDSEGLTPLHYACRSRSHELVEFLISEGADPRVQDGMGNTPLHIAAKLGSAKIISVLRDAGGDMEAFNHEQATPLDFVLARLETLKKKQEAIHNCSKFAEQENWGTRLVEELSDGEDNWWGREWEEPSYEKDVEDGDWKRDYFQRKPKDRLEGGLLKEREERRKQILEERARESRRILAEEEAKDRAWRIQVLQKKSSERFRLYEQSWNKFSKSCNLCLSYRDVPFPVEKGEEGDLARVLLHGVPPEEQKRLLRKEVLRWHPDKFLQKCGTRLQGPDHERILGRVNEIFQALHQLYSSLVPMKL